ncbi:MAG: hypothetical protein M3Z66_14475 [Chloroflexota bacterium]|nr:hypothetical protein [Chloroflexota bacterium]
MNEATNKPTRLQEGSVDGQGRAPDQAPTITKGAVLAGGKTPDKAPVLPANGQPPSQTNDG